MSTVIFLLCCRLTDGVTIDGDVEEGARDLLELNSADADAAAETVVDTVGVAVGGANGHSSRKRSSSGISKCVLCLCIVPLVCKIDCVCNTGILRSTCCEWMGFLSRSSSS